MQDMTGADAALTAFRFSLKYLGAKRGSSVPALGVYRLAMALGRPDLPGIAPIGPVVRRSSARKVRAAGMFGEPAPFVRPSNPKTENAALKSPRSHEPTPPDHAILATLRGQGVEPQMRREPRIPERQFPGGSAVFDGLSFAPKPEAPKPAAGGPEGFSEFASSPAAAPPVSWLRKVAGSQDEVFAGAAPKSGVEIDDRRLAAMAAPSQGFVAPRDIESALENYFFLQSRLPPIGAAAFNPLISPVWAGLKIPF